MRKLTIIPTEGLQIESLAKRSHDMQIGDILYIEASENVHPHLAAVAEKINAAKERNAAVILMMGAHVIRSGVQRFIIDLIRHGFISGIAFNGACVIHDFELALVGGTTESVARYIKDGRFGFWHETGEINDIINQAHRDGQGFGRAVGIAILNGAFPYKDISILAQAVRYDVPVTVHISIGCDIIHQFPNFDGAATGAASYRDFLTFGGLVQQLEGGVVMNFGSAVMAPEVFLKALSMARNLAREPGKTISRFTTLVCDLHTLPEDFSREAPKDSAAYYFRPWKTMLVRTVADGGESFYVKGHHRETIPGLWTALNEILEKDADR